VDPVAGGASRGGASVGVSGVPWIAAGGRRRQTRCKGIKVKDWSLTRVGTHSP
jgi:hypothetical protein